MPSHRAELEIGDRIGAWTIDARLGAGALGVVYAASSPGGERVALKVWEATRLSNPERDAYFKAATLAGSLEHPNLSVLVDVGDTPSDLCFAATGLLAGAPLRRLLAQSGPLQPRHALHFACEVARALEALHAVGLHHGDVHPGQVFVERGGSARLLDTAQLPLKRRLGRALSRWSAPEEVHASPITPGRDVHGLGRSVLEMLTQRSPIDALGALSELALPRALIACLMRSLEREPAARPSLRELALELRATLRKLAAPDAEVPRGEPLPELRAALGRLAPLEAANDFIPAAGRASTAGGSGDP